MDHDPEFGEEHLQYTQDPAYSDVALRNHRLVCLTLESAQIVIHGARFRKFENRELKDIRRTPYTKI